eukprot:TRINITY_DN6976_c0_g1_i1.p1 TRINITY_DN6976_c0_g1~~TRINITY_DN6976_c0_g1_i1.p1  ORF type:complete len:905 (+),score=319.92 TRINITY_DN6976_c0_g1_i1:125-2839(+)
MCRREALDPSEYLQDVGAAALLQDDGDGGYQVGQRVRLIARVTSTSGMCLVAGDIGTVVRVPGTRRESVAVVRADPTRGQRDFLFNARRRHIEPFGEEEEEAAGSSAAAATTDEQHTPSASAEYLDLSVPPGAVERSDSDRACSASPLSHTDAPRPRRSVWLAAEAVTPKGRLAAKVEAARERRRRLLQSPQRGCATPPRVCLRRDPDGTVHDRLYREAAELRERRREGAAEAALVRECADRAAEEVSALRHRVRAAPEALYRRQQEWRGAVDRRIEGIRGAQRDKEDRVTDQRPRPLPRSEAILADRGDYVGPTASWEERADAYARCRTPAEQRGNGARRRSSSADPAAAARVRSLRTVAAASPLPPTPHDPALLIGGRHVSPCRGTSPSPPSDPSPPPSPGVGERLHADAAEKGRRRAVMLERRLAEEAGVDPRSGRVLFHPVCSPHTRSQSEYPPRRRRREVAAHLAAMQARVTASERRFTHRAAAVRLRQAPFCPVITERSARIAALRRVRDPRLASPRRRSESPCSDAAWELSASSRSPRPALSAAADRGTEGFMRRLAADAARRAYRRLEEQQRKRRAEGDECSFRPMISAASREMADRAPPPPEQSPRLVSPPRRHASSPTAHPTLIPLDEITPLSPPPPPPQRSPAASPQRQSPASPDRQSPTDLRRLVEEWRTRWEHADRQMQMLSVSDGGREAGQLRDDQDAALPRWDRADRQMQMLSVSDGAGQLRDDQDARWEHAGLGASEDAPAENLPEWAAIEGMLRPAQEPAVSSAAAPPAPPLYLTGLKQDRYTSPRDVGVAALLRDAAAAVSLPPSTAAATPAQAGIDAAAAPSATSLRALAAQLSLPPSAAATPDQAGIDAAAAPSATSLRALAAQMSLPPSTPPVADLHPSPELI